MAISYGEPYEKPMGTLPEPQRLRFVPSEGLREIIRPFYRPTATEALAKVSLWSTAYLPAERVGGVNLIYEDPTAPNQNSEHLITRFNRRELESPLRHPLPLLSYVRYELLGSKSRIRVNLRLGTIQADDDRFAMIPGFAQQITHGYIDTFFDISGGDFIPNREFGRAAIASLNSELGIDHPARERTPVERRFVDPDTLYAVREPGFRYSAIVDPKWRPQIVSSDSPDDKPA